MIVVLLTLLLGVVVLQEAVVVRKRAVRLERDTGNGARVIGCANRVRLTISLIVKNVSSAPNPKTPTRARPVTLPTQPRRLPQQRRRQATQTLAYHCQSSRMAIGFAAKSRATRTILPAARAVSNAMYPRTGVICSLLVAMNAKSALRR